MVLLQGLCYVVDITMVFLTFIGIFDFVFHLVELSRVDERGLLLPYRTSLLISKPTRLGIFNTKLSDLPMINADHLLWLIHDSFIGIRYGTRNA